MSSDEHSLALQPSEGRYQYERRLGQGGAGAVYLVRDRETGERLALKRLLRADDTSLVRLKREFRSLAGIHHRNLIQLYELGHDGTSAYFTMEYVEGLELHAYLSAVQSGRPGQEEAETGRVLGTFHQIASGIRALHRMGMLHRDLKPSNVMVAGDRVVLLDFGLALEVGQNAATITQDDIVSGTPAYMAPEQIQGEDFGEPNDWYSFGAMLYEALSGCLPIEGNVVELLHRKLQRDPVSIDSLVPDLPPEVSELCTALLARDPRARPNGDRILSMLEPYEEPGLRSVMRSLRVTNPSELSANQVDFSIFGRDGELAKLRQAFRSVQQGEFVAAHIVGESGAGKSALMQRFAKELELHDPGTGGSAALVLRSRCYERESVPFKALDGMIDAVVEHLLRENDIVVGHVLPADLLALTQLFPALHRLPAVRHLLKGSEALGAAQQVRDQAFAALRELLGRLAAQRPIVLWIDDLQWGDLDSAGILTSWVARAERMPHVMLALSYRSEDVATSACLTLLLQRGSAELVIPVAPLDDEHIRELCQQRFELVSAAMRGRAEVIERIVLEARGSPFLASQLTTLAASRPSWSEADLASLSLQQLVVQRSSTLSDAARCVLNVLSVAARPITLSLVVRTAGVEREVRTVMHELQSASMIRTREVSGERLLEVYHDRLREAVSGGLTRDERLAIDQRLLRELRALGSSDVDWLHGLALGAGSLEDALRYGIAAAERASAALAFERAAQLYERCLELSEETARDGSALWEKLAVAHAHAGHGNKAATTYLQAARRADPERGIQLKRLAASHFLRSGHFEEGERLLHEVLVALKLEAPQSETGLYAAIGWERARLQLRGLRFTRRQRSELSPDLLYAGELCGMLSIELAAYDPLRAAFYQVRALRMALDSGEPELIARALCAAATMACVSGSEGGGKRARELLDEATAIASTIDSPLALNNICSARAICAFLTGRFAECVELSYEAERLYRTLTIEGEYYHRFTILSARAGALLQLGEYQQARLELQNTLKEAEATENVSAVLHLSLGLARSDIVADRAEVAAARLEQQQAQLPRQGFGILHLFHMVAVMRTGCATGDYDWALRVSEANWQSFQRSVMRLSASHALIAHATRARLLLNRCVRDGEGKAAAKLVAPQLKAMIASKHPAAKGAVMRTKARLELLQGRRDAATELLRKSSQWFEETEAFDEAAQDRYALGMLLGGDEGRELQTRAIAHLRKLGVVSPERELRSYFPELAPPQAG